LYIYIYILRTMYKKTEEYCLILDEVKLVMCVKNVICKQIDMTLFHRGGLHFELVRVQPKISDPAHSTGGIDED
jgi:hypothetical protein